MTTVGGSSGLSFLAAVIVVLITIAVGSCLSTEVCPSVLEASDCTAGHFKLGKGNTLARRMHTVNDLKEEFKLFGISY